jgi:light-harvesting complex I chlorophyll a/b binding protein 1
MWLEMVLVVQAPVGFWDPLKLAADGDVDAFKRRRAAELKHGRICMLATLGYIVPEYFKFRVTSPSLGLKFAEVPSGIAAVSKVPSEGWLQFGLFLGHMEGKCFRQDPKRAPGDLEGFGFLGVGRNFVFIFEAASIMDPEVRKKRLSAEIANGRLALVALVAMLFQNGTVGSTGPEMWLEMELGCRRRLASGTRSSWPQTATWMPSSAVARRSGSTAAPACLQRWATLCPSASSSRLPRRPWA